MPAGNYWSTRRSRREGQELWDAAISVPHVPSRCRRAVPDAADLHPSDTMFRCETLPVSVKTSLTPTQRLSRPQIKFPPSHPATLNSSHISSLTRSFRQALPLGLDPRLHQPPVGLHRPVYQRGDVGRRRLQRRWSHREDRAWPLPFRPHDPPARFCRGSCPPRLRCDGRGLDSVSRTPPHYIQ